MPRRSLPSKKFVPLKIPRSPTSQIVIYGICSMCNKSNIEYAVFPHGPGYIMIAEIFFLYCCNFPRAFPSSFV